MTPEYIRALIDYHYWARDRALASAETLSPEQLAKPLGSSFSSVLDTLIHLRYADWVWYSRWQGTSPSAPPPDTSALTTVAAVRDIWMPLEQQIRAFVGSLSAADLQRPFDYKLMNGQPGTSIFWEMIVHVVNHGSYHRGQIATMMRQLGTKAQSTDMIVFFREQSALR
jgi:uncharacterized damage-inducible protein DinB